MTANHPLENRLKKQYKHLHKWARKQSITCFRLYDRDIPDYPLIIDWIDGDVVMWIYSRKKDDTKEKEELFYRDIINAVCDGLNIATKNLYIKFRKAQKGLQTQHEKLAKTCTTKIITEGNLRFEVNLSDYLDIGLFLDHRKTRSILRDEAKHKRCLNLFAYTGAFSAYMLDGGAFHVSSVDLNKNYSAWLEKNLKLNSLGLKKQHRMVTDDCLTFLYYESHRKKYDLIFCDPPTFSNSKKMDESFSINTDYPELITACMNCLNPDGKLFFSTNSQKFKLDENAIRLPLTIKNITGKTRSEDFKNKMGHQCWEITHRV